MFQLDKYDVIYQLSSIDGEKYLVRDLSDKEDAANLLASIKSNIYTLSNHLYQSKSNQNQLVLLLLSLVRIFYL